MGSSGVPVDAGVRFGVLGPLHVSVDGHDVVLASPIQRRLLAALLLDVGVVLPTGRLADLLWGDDQPHDPSGAVHTHVSRLRALLSQHGGAAAGAVVVTRSPGYLLAVDRAHVDAGRFDGLVARARSAPTAEETADLLGRALELWRGPALEELDHELARSEATRLAEQRVGAQELRADALLALGRHGDAVGELEVVVARHPLRERLRGQLIVALARAGRQGEALAAYRDLRDQLVHQLGVEPSAALQRLERAVLQREEPLPWPTHTWPTRREDRGPASATPAVPADVLTSFVGRDAEVRAVADALTGGRVVVLTGVGGIGKSRLAVHVARRLADTYADGVWRADLVGVEHPAAVVEVVAAAVGVVPAPGVVPEDALEGRLRDRHLLLVVDNCEHQRDAVAALVDRIARTCPGVDVLATSREPLGVVGERRWPVPPLPVDDGGEGAAVQLFRDRAVDVDPTFDLDDAGRERVAEICRRLDGIPLGIELAAARMRSMTAADVVRRLDRRFDLLRAGSGTGGDRHRSLRAVIDWSCAMLPARSRRLLERLAAFAGWFELSAAETVCAGRGLPAAEVASHVADLVDHALVVADRSADHGRYRLLETVRVHADARLAERGEAATWRHRHAAFHADLAGEAAHGLRGPEEAAWVDVVESALVELRAAHAWACAEGEVDLALRIPANLRTYAYYRQRDEVHAWALEAIALPGADRSPAWPAGRIAAGAGCVQRGELDLGVGHAEAVLATTTDPALRLRARQLLAETALYRGRLREVDHHGAAIVAAARGDEHAYERALGHLYRVHAAAYDGDAEGAHAQLQEGWRAVEAAGTPSLRAGYCYLEGEVRIDADPDAALAHLNQAIELARSVRNRFIEGVAGVAVASVVARHGDPAEALRAFEEVIEHWRSSGDWTHLWPTVRNLIVLLVRVDEPQPAAVLLGAVRSTGRGAQAFGDDARRIAEADVALRAALGPRGAEDAQSRGRAMADDQVVRYALDELRRLLGTTAAAG